MSEGADPVDAKHAAIAKQRRLDMGWTEAGGWPEEPAVESPAVPLAAPPLPPAAPQKPEQAPALVFVHPLESAPLNSKIVVTAVGAVLAGPPGHSMLGKQDPAQKLPEGAKITKMLIEGKVRYLSTQLSPVQDFPDKTYENVAEAISNFLQDFHPSGNAR